MIRVLVWNEYVHEKTQEKVANLYPNGIHGVIADFLGKEEGCNYINRKSIVNEWVWSKKLRPP